VNICLYANIFNKYLLECEIRLKFCDYLLINKYFEANICQYVTIANICSEMNIPCKMYDLHQIQFFYANLCKYFEANMKQMMQINGV
jgi:hypothetical protein